jgi:predicted lipoprotein with Yx(FWY)xxD motif
MTNFKLPRIRRAFAALVAVTALAGLATVAAPALAGASAVVKSGSAGGSKVVVNAHGRTLYALAPETVKHLLCKSSKCLSNWLPLRTGKSTSLTASGVKGKLGRLSRGGGKYQVTLRGLPLYTFVGDTGKGQATGKGLKSFGGKWHTVSP